MHVDLLSPKPRKDKSQDRQSPCLLNNYADISKFRGLINFETNKCGKNIFDIRMHKFPLKLMFSASIPYSKRNCLIINDVLVHSSEMLEPCFLAEITK